MEHRLVSHQNPKLCTHGMLVFASMHDRNTHLVKPPPSSSGNEDLLYKIWWKDRGVFIVVPRYRPNLVVQPLARVERPTYRR